MRGANKVVGSPVTGCEKKSRQINANSAIFIIRTHASSRDSPFFMLHLLYVRTDSILHASYMRTL